MPTRDIRSELEAIKETVGKQYDYSHRVLGDVGTRLDAMLEKIHNEQDSKSLVADAPDVANDLNNARRDLRQLSLDVMRPVKDIKEISDRLIQHVKDSAGGETLGKVKELVDPKRIVDSLPSEESYPAVGEFRMWPLEIAVVALFWLSLVPLFFQVFIDFGLTIAVIFGVSAMRRHATRQRN